ncbi:MAG: DsbA family protein, partial [Solirubrobacteraceae bacterium]
MRRPLVLADLGGVAVASEGLAHLVSGQAHQAERQMTETAAGDGLDFRFDIARAGNTFDGHRLVHLAQAHGLQDAMKERLLRAYFTEGEL